MLWLELKDSGQLKHLIRESDSKPFVIFKHSTRCSISSMVKNRVERHDKNGLNIPFYFLDLLQYRQISKEIEENLSVEHKSPQILLIENGKCVYHSSHGSIDLEDLKRFITESQN